MEAAEEEDEEVALVGSFFFSVCLGRRRRMEGVVCWKVEKNGVGRGGASFPPGVEMVFFPFFLSCYRNLVTY